MSKEYIEREAAIKDLEALCVDGKMIGDENHTFVDFSDVINVIANQPTADVQEVRHGEWLEDDYGYCHCSNCRYEHDSPECITPYCPECGAIMDKE